MEKGLVKVVINIDLPNLKVNEEYVWKGNLRKEGAINFADGYAQALSLMLKNIMKPSSPSLDGHIWWIDGEKNFVIKVVDQDGNLI